MPAKHFLWGNTAHLKGTDGDMKPLKHKQLAMLLLEARKGNMDAFNAIYQHTAHVQYLQIRQIVSDPKEAEDALQETYLVFYRHMDKINPPTALVAYLNRLSYYISKNMQRSTNRRLMRMTNMDTIDTYFPGGMPSPAKEVEKQAVTASVRNSLSCLDERERLVLIMHYYQQLSIKQIAQSLDLSLATVKRIHKSAKENLRLLLTKEGISSWGLLFPVFKKLIEEQAGELSLPELELPSADAAPEGSLSYVAAESVGSAATSSAGSAAGMALKGLVCSCLVGGVLAVGCLVGVPRFFPEACNDKQAPGASILAADEELTTILFEDEETGIDEASIWCETPSGDIIRPEHFEFVEGGDVSLLDKINRKTGRASFRLPEEDVTLYFSDRAGNKNSSVIRCR